GLQLTLRHQQPMPRQLSTDSFKGQPALAGRGYTGNENESARPQIRGHLVVVLPTHIRRRYVVQPRIIPSVHPHRKPGRMHPNTVGSSISRTRTRPPRNRNAARSTACRRLSRSLACRFHRDAKCFTITPPTAPTAAAIPTSHHQLSTPSAFTTAPDTGASTANTSAAATTGQTRRPPHHNTPSAHRRSPHTTETPRTTQTPCSHPAIRPASEGISSPSRRSPLTIDSAIPRAGGQQLCEPHPVC